VLVPAPREKAAPVVFGHVAKAAKTRRFGARLTAALAFCVMGGLALAFVPSSPPPAVLECPERDVSLVARDFTLPVSLAAHERLVLSTDARGYTHVTRERRSAGAPDVVFVAERDDPVLVVAAGGDRGETFRARPGESVVLESAAPGRVRIAVVRTHARLARRPDMCYH
jgi:hypothetical protein